MRQVFLLTLGCPKNTVASGRLQKGLADCGIEVTSDIESAEAMIVNTCGFIEAATEESIDCLLELGRDKNARGQKLIAIGCLAERHGEELAEAIPELDACLGLGELDQLPALLGTDRALVLEGQARDERTYGYLEITTGCNHACSFCVIPSLHGAFHSRPTSTIIGEAGAIAAGGSREIVLIGQETGSYGSDLNPKTDLPDLLSALSAAGDVAWLRVMYLQPYHVTDKLADVIEANPRICEYLDIPVQHAQTDILRAMNRRGNSTDYLDRIASVRAKLPDIALRTSVIVGFPGETYDQVLELADFLKAAEFDYVGVFEYSAEEGTPAAEMAGQISAAEKRRRADQIRLLADEISRKRRARWLGRTIDVLVESSSGDSYTGRARFQAPEIDGEVVFEGKNHSVGTIVPVRIDNTDDYELRGRSLDA